VHANEKGRFQFKEMPIQDQNLQVTENTGYRIDVGVHDLLMGGPRVAPLKPGDVPLTLPDPQFPRHPELRGDIELDARLLPKDGSPYRSRVSPFVIRRALRGWLYPYIRSRVMPGQFHPIIAYLFTEYKCNLECHYCWSFNNKVSGMSEDTARRAIDWLHDTGCRVLALMGGEVLLRPQFAQKVVSYAAKKGFFVYVPTNGRLMRKEVIDWLGDAGVATINLAVDSVEDRKELPKALAPIRSNFEYLIKKQYAYGFCVFFNINITRINLEDVKRLTEIAHDSGIATDYHINESPMLDPSGFKHAGGNETYITPEDWPAIDSVVDWLIEKNKSGYKMVNSARRMEEMKAFMRGKLQEWDCRAGHNSLIIRTDGTLAPCFPMYPSTYNWGTVEAPRFDPHELLCIKQNCQPHCFSTLNHTLAYCYNASRAIRWTLKQALRGFQGVTGSFED